MTKFLEEVYLGFGIVYYVYDNGTFSARSKSLTTNNGDSNFSGVSTFKSLIDCRRNIREQIEYIKETKISSYKELALKIQNTLIWTSHDTCEVDPDVIKILIENFNHAKE